MEREGKPRLRNQRAHASNLTKTFSHKSSLSSSDRASNWKNLTATPIQLETAAKSSSCISDWATGKASGSQGITSNQTKLLGDIISKELKALESFVKEHNPTYNIDQYFCPKIRVENRNRSFQETMPHRFAVRS